MSAAKGRAQLGMQCINVPGCLTPTSLAGSHNLHVVVLYLHVQPGKRTSAVIPGFTMLSDAKVVLHGL